MADAFIPYIPPELMDGQLLKSVTLTASHVNTGNSGSDVKQTYIGSLSMPILPTTAVKVETSVVTGNARVPSSSSTSMYINMGIQPFNWTWSVQNRETFSVGPFSRVIDPVEDSYLFARSYSVYITNKTSGYASASAATIDSITITLWYYHIGFTA